MQLQNKIPTHRYNFGVALTSASVGLANFALQGASELTVAAFAVAATNTVCGIYDLNKNRIDRAFNSITNHLSSLWKSSVNKQQTTTEVDDGFRYHMFK